MIYLTLYFVFVVIQWVCCEELVGTHGAVYVYDRKGYRLGNGSFGEAIAGTKIVGNHLEPVALKFEKIKPNKPIYVTREKNFYNILGEHPGIPKFHDCLRDKKGNAILVIELLGHNLNFYRKKLGGKYSIKTSMMIGIQLLTVIEYLHSKNVIYNDIKADNFVVGYENESNLYILDFGLCTFYMKNGSHIEPQKHEASAGRGTGHYMSVYAHKHTVLSRRDDVESIGYMLIEFLQGKLPWTGANMDDIYHKKSQTKIKRLVGNICTDTLVKFLIYARRLKFKDEPNYEYLRELLLNELNSQPGHLQFDWIGANIPRPKSNIDQVAKEKGFHVQEETPLSTKPDTLGDHHLKVISTNIVHPVTTNLVPISIVPHLMGSTIPASVNLIVQHPAIVYH
ncbi:casein kinase I [Contarinia nasturtii]|uniref:casein kinase I n=1 Tax=Contarinia nasturtii TaxID=265458 RepID=UPI0012D44F3F|nr:casein kinase I [Contarinia nasturtii]